MDLNSFSNSINLHTRRITLKHYWSPSGSIYENEKILIAPCRKWNLLTEILKIMKRSISGSIYENEKILIAPRRKWNLLTEILKIMKRRNCFDVISIQNLFVTTKR